VSLNNNIMEKNNTLTVPVAIVAAGVLIAGAIFFTRGVPNDNNRVNNGLPNLDTTSVRAVDASDHILGNPNATIKIIEYSDTECPFCKSFHTTMHRIMDEYGKDAKVAWVYRHFPLYKGAQPLHPQAGKQAEATECAAELGGNVKFWEFIDRLYEITPSNNGLALSELPKIAEHVGLNRQAFETCLASGKYAQKISDSYDEALEAGATGTPYTVIVAEGRNPIPVPGAQPYAAIKTIIDTLLAGE
jgi:protein-disulfide isomerase